MIFLYWVCYADWGIEHELKAYSKLIHISHLLQYASNLDGEKHLNVDLQKELAELKVHTELSMKVTIFLLIANVKSIVSSTLQLNISRMILFTLFSLAESDWRWIVHDRLSLMRIQG